MPKIAYISDLHLEFRPQHILDVIDQKFSAFRAMGLPEALEADVLVIAGDTHPNPTIQRLTKSILEKHYGIPVIMVTGNHDHYDRDFPSSEMGDITTIAGLRFAWATLWTWLTPMEEIICKRFADFKFIKGVTPELWNNTHMNQVQFLRESRADVIITHHTPSHQSIHETFHGHATNGFFANNLDFGLFPNTKLWIHGHVHNVFDYIQEDIRVICNPYGYPFEKHLTGATVKIVEV